MIPGSYLQETQCWICDIIKIYTADVHACVLFFLLPNNAIYINFYIGI